MISGLIKAGNLDRRIQVLGLTYSKVRGEARETYAEILSTRAAKLETTGSEDEGGGTLIAVGTVEWVIRYHSVLATEPKNYEAMRLVEITDDPTYLLDGQGQIMRDLYGNPLISLVESQSITYEILHIAEVGRKIGHTITAQRWR